MKSIEILSTYFSIEDSGMFIADRDIVDSLKIETSTLSPAQEEQIRSTAGVIVATLLEQYGSFMPEETRERVNGTVDRILFMESDTYLTHKDEWNGFSYSAHPKHSKSYAHFGRKGQLLVFSNLIDPELYPDNFLDYLSEASKQSFLKAYGSEGIMVIKQKLALAYTTGALAHEIAHQFQDTSLPEVFSESAVRYYEKQISEKIIGTAITEELDEKRIGFYKDLLQEFGDDVHKLNFGKYVAANKKSEILSKLTAEVMDKLYPGGYTRNKLPITAGNVEDSKKVKEINAGNKIDTPVPSLRSVTGYS